MRPTRTRAIELLRPLTALGLVAWLAGAGCLLGCAASIGATASARSANPSETHAARSESHVALQADSCAAMRGRGCCGSLEEQEADASAGADNRGSRSAMHCPLGRRHPSDPARKVLVDTSPAASTLSIRPAAPDAVYVSRAYAADSLVRDRGSTYLRCCVFLI